MLEQQAKHMLSSRHSFRDHLQRAIKNCYEGEEAIKSLSSVQRIKNKNVPAFLSPIVIEFSCLLLDFGLLCFCWDRQFIFFLLFVFRLPGVPCPRLGFLLLPGVVLGGIHPTIWAPLNQYCQPPPPPRPTSHYHQTWEGGRWGWESSAKLHRSHERRRRREVR